MDAPVNNSKEMDGINPAQEAFGINDDNDEPTPCSSSSLRGSAPDITGDQDSSEGGTQLLRELMENQEGLDGTIKEMKATLVRIYRSMTLKDEEICKLTNRVTELNKLKMKGESEPVNLHHHENRNDEEMGACEISPPIPVLPEEVWEMILGKVKDPNDLWNLINTCQLFNTLLRGWKTGYMLGQALPHLYQHLPGEKLLECRLVCKSWEGAVDTFLENHPSLRPHSDENDPRHLNFINPMKEKKLGDNYMLTHTRLKKYISDGKNGDVQSFPFKVGRSPFIGRSCTLYFVLDYGNHGGDILDNDSGDEDIVEAEGRPQIVANEIVTEFWDCLHKFFTTYGDDIWYLTIYSPPYLRNHPMHGKLVQFHSEELFEYVPNLRKLTLEGEIYHSSGEGLPVARPASNLESIALDLSWTREFPEALINRFHMQLKELKIRDDFFTWEPLSRFEWAQLTELNLNGSMERLELASLYGMRMPQLTKLVLKVTNVNVNFTENILELIRKLSETTRLSVLRLERGIGYLDKGWHALNKHEYAPATLKTLEIDMGGEQNTTPFTFLLRFFPHLENLFIYNMKSEADIISAFLENTFYDGTLATWDQLYISGIQNVEDMVEVVEVNKFANGGNFYDSNVWELLTSLKVFAFEKDVYTRHGYEEHLYRKENAG